MSSNSPVPVSRTTVAVPRTAVPLGIADPVEQARAELKAALAAIEQKANVPRRVVEVTGHTDIGHCDKLQPAILDLALNSASDNRLDPFS